jgi:hypothetical protein
MKIELDTSKCETYIATRDSDETHCISDNLEDILSNWDIDSETELAEKISSCEIELYIGRKVDATVKIEWSIEGEDDE